MLPEIIVSVPEWSKGVDSSSTVFALVGSNPTADKYITFANATRTKPKHILLLNLLSVRDPTLVGHLSRSANFF